MISLSMSSLGGKYTITILQITVTIVLELILIAKLFVTVRNNYFSAKY